FHVYCDESQTSGERYMIFGGIIAATNNLATFARIMAEWRLANKMDAELKWTRVANQRYAEYKSLVDLFFQFVATRRFHFKALVLDTRDPNYRVFSDGDKELGFYKFYYQFLLHNFAPSAVRYRCAIHVFVDERSVHGDPFGLLHTVLNHGIRKRFDVTA